MPLVALAVAGCCLLFLWVILRYENRSRHCQTDFAFVQKIWFSYHVGEDLDVKDEDDHGRIDE